MDLCLKSITLMTVSLEYEDVLQQLVFSGLCFVQQLVLVYVFGFSLPRRVSCSNDLCSSSLCFVQQNVVAYIL